MVKQFLTYREFLNEGLNSSRATFLNTGKIGPEDFERLTLLDVTPTKKYLDSICRFYLEGHSEQDIKTYIDKFHTLGSNLPKKDINLYSFDELKSSLDNYTSKNQKDKEVTKDINVVYEDERFFIVRPDTFEQSAKYGRGTKWCITATDGTGEEAWKGYRRLGINFYFVTDKSLPSTNPLYKVAIAINKDGEIEKGKRTTVNSKNEGIDGEKYIRKNMLPRELFVPREIPPLEKWGIDLSKLKDGVYDGRIIVPKDVKEFKGFEEELGLDIKEVEGSLLFYNCNDLTSVSNLPEYVGESLSFWGCHSLTSVSNIPEYVGLNLNFGYSELLNSVSNLPEYVGGTLSFFRCISLTSLPNLPEKLEGFLSFEDCTSLTSISNLPDYIGGILDFSRCTSLTSISNIPTTVGIAIYSIDCPFFEGMTEEQIREKYNISR